jgi:chloride channel 3/4/5
MFIRMFCAWNQSRFHRLLARKPVREVALVALVTAIMTWPNRFARMEIASMVGTLFSECTPEDDLNGLCV